MVRQAGSVVGKTQLARKDWIEAAINVMVASSVEQVRVEKLATELGVSKGSFYWHFQDRQDLLMAILDLWKERATFAIQARLDRAEPLPQRRLLLFMQLPVRSEASLRAADLELAILGWSRRSPAARRAVEHVDELRTEHLTSLFREAGVDEVEAQFRGHKAYAFLRYAAQRRDLEISDRARMIAKVHAELVCDLGDLGALADAEPHQD